MNISKVAVNKPTTILILFIVVASLGLFTALRLPIDLFPDIELPFLAIITNYENAGPEEVERSVTRLIESAISGITGLNEFSSTSSFGSSMVIMELNYGTNFDTAINEIRDRIEFVKGILPEGADSPTIFRADPSMIPIMSLVLTGNRSPEELLQYAEDTIAPSLEQIDGVASANIIGGREKIIRVDIPRDRLEAYELSITQVAQMIGAQNIYGAGGQITEGDINYTINTSGQYESINDIKNTVISYKMTDTDGTTIPQLRTILLRDVADVYEGYQDETSLAFFNGAPSVLLSIQKQSGKNSLQTAQAVYDKIEEIKPTLPLDIQIEVGMDTTELIQTSIDQVSSSAISGAILAVLVLLFFLRSIKSTAIIAITIPVSLVVTLGVMYFSGLTLNLMTLAGLALGVGMLVDNSIVILENIYSYRERGTKATVAAILGSQEMTSAILSSTLTTICVFLPLIMFSAELGVIGQMFSGLTFTIVFSLLCSLIVAVLLVPVLASKYLKLERAAELQRVGFIGKIDRALGSAFERLDTVYARAVRKVLKRKAILIVTIIALFIASVVLIPVVGFEFMPTEATTTVTLNLEMPKGTRLEITEEIIRQMEVIALQELKGVEKTTVSVGGGGGMMGGGGSTSAGSMDIVLYSYADRQEGWDSDVTAKEKLRPYFDMFPGANFSFSETSSFGATGGGVDIIIKSDDLDLLKSTADDIVALLDDKGSDLVTEPKSDLEDGLPEVNIIVDRNKLYNLGLNVYGISNEIRANINGQLAGMYSDDGTDIDIIVGLSEEDRAKITDLEQITVNNSQGQGIPLSSFASWQESTSPVAINRENQARTIHVTANPVMGTSITEIQRNVEDLIQQNIPYDDRVSIEYGGDAAELLANLSIFAIIILMAIILVFSVMASQFESFMDPFIVIFTIPLSLIGIIVVYLMTGAMLNTISAVGLLILVGIIVNNGIVLIDYTNLLRKRGLTIEEACVEAAKSRLRPILMTTLTTVLALVPMAFFPGEGSEMVQPIGQTVLGGLSFGTLMTLFLMPVLYFIFNTRRERRAAKRAMRKEEKMKLHLARLKEEKLQRGEA